MQNGQLILWTGPMKSGKSDSLLTFFEQLRFSLHVDKSALFQPQANKREEHITSRSGRSSTCTKISDLQQIPLSTLDFVGIDEIHMFQVNQVSHIKKLLNGGTNVLISGLDMDYRGTLFPIIVRLLEFPPTEWHRLTAICESCRKPGAYFTQILQNNIAVTQDLPSVIPETAGSELIYSPRCPSCFVRVD